MHRTLVLALLVTAGCGRIGFELSQEEGSGTAAGGSGAAAGDGSTRGGSVGSGGSGSAGRGSGGGVTGGSGGSSGDAGAAGLASGGQTGVAGSGAGGALGGMGSGGAGGRGGGGGQVTDAGPPSGGTPSTTDAGAACSPGAPEICDGLDNDCNLLVDETGCAAQCEGRAFGGRGYMLCGGNRKWDEAKAECETAGLQLARIESQAEQDFVFSFVFESQKSEVWIGGSDVAVEGDWRWVDGTPFWSGPATPTGTPVGGAYTNWLGTSEPDDLDNGQSPSGDCLSLIEAQNGGWVDQGCNYFHRLLCRTL